MDQALATDYIIDFIARIELHRQEMRKESDLAAACNEALRKLHECLDQERDALQAHGPGAAHAGNIEALTAEIERVKRLAGAAAMPRHKRPPRQQPAGQGRQQHNHPRSKGRRTMGRNSGR